MRECTVSAPVRDSGTGLVVLLEALKLIHCASPSSFGVVPVEVNSHLVSTSPEFLYCASGNILYSRRLLPDISKHLNSSYNLLTSSAATITHQDEGYILDLSMNGLVWLTSLQLLFSSAGSELVYVLLYVQCAPPKPHHVTIQNQ